MLSLNVILPSFLTPRRSFIKTVALAGAVVPLGLRQGLAAAPEKPSWQMQNDVFGARFDLDSGRLTVFRHGRPLLLNAVCAATTAPGRRALTETDYARSVKVLKRPSR